MSNIIKALIVSDEHGRYYFNELHRAIAAASVFGFSVQATHHLRERSAPIPELRDYDQLWLICQRSNSVTAFQLALEEIAQIERFLEAGKGVFASGDHSSLGEAIGGQIRWVKQMRNWSITNAGTYGAGSIDTVDAAQPPASETDSKGKRIYPARFDSQPHLLLRNKDDQYLCWLPDHEHEGQLAVANVSDFGGNASAIETVAFAVSWERHQENDRVSRCCPRLSPVLKCFDPAKATVPGAPGPIVVDSTFHHWLDENVSEIAKNNPEAYEHWCALIRNIVAFLSPHKAAQAEQQIVDGLKGLPEVANSVELEVEGRIKHALMERPAALRFVERRAMFDGRPSNLDAIASHLADRLREPN